MAVFATVRMHGRALSVWKLDHSCATLVNCCLCPGLCWGKAFSLQPGSKQDAIAMLCAVQQPLLQAVLLAHAANKSRL